MDMIDFFFLVQLEDMECLVEDKWSSWSCRLDQVVEYYDNPQLKGTTAVTLVGGKTVWIREPFELFDAIYKNAVKRAKNMAVKAGVLPEH
jgi:hypothetical protein